MLRRGPVATNNKAFTAKVSVVVVECNAHNFVTALGTIKNVFKHATNKKYTSIKNLYGN